MAALSGLLLGAQTMAQVAASRAQARGIQQQGDYSAGIDEQNAGLADRAAQDAIERGALAENRTRQGTRRAISSQRAALAASGVDINDGSAADLQGDTAYNGELDAITQRNNARREAFGYQVEAVNMRQRAALTRQATANAASSARMAGYSTLLTAAGQGLEQYAATRSMRAPTPLSSAQQATIDQAGLAVANRTPRRTY